MVCASSHGRDRMAMPSEKAAPQQAVTSGTADQGLGNSNEHDRAAPAKAPEINLSPAVVAAATADPSKAERSCEGSKGAGAASSGRPGKSQAVSRKPLTPQQHAVVAALMVVVKRAMLQGHEFSISAQGRLWCNNRHTLVVQQFLSNEQELRNMKDIERLLQEDDRDLVDLLARQCTAAGFQPLQVFTRSLQCGSIAACRAAHSRGEAAALARHQQMAELHRVFAQHTYTATWLRNNVSLLVQQGVPERMAELIMLELVLLAELCKRCFWSSDTWQEGTVDYAALEHLMPGK